MTRSEIVAAARGYLGAPFRHQGRSLQGIDCVGLVIAVARDVGAVPPDFDVTGYDRRPDGSMTKFMREHLVRVPKAEAKPGSVVQIAADLIPWHVGIMLDAARFIHASGIRDRVCVDVLDHNWQRRRSRAVSVYDFPGVIDG